MNRARIWSLYVPQDREWIKRATEANANGSTASYVLDILEKELKHDRFIELENDLRDAGFESEAETLGKIRLLYIARKNGQMGQRQ